MNYLKFIQNMCHFIKGKKYFKLGKATTGNTFCFTCSNSLDIMVPVEVVSSVSQLFFDMTTFKAGDCFGPD